MYDLNFLLHEQTSSRQSSPAQHNGANDGSGIVGPDMQPNLAGQAYQKLYHQVSIIVNVSS